MTSYIYNAEKNGMKDVMSNIGTKCKVSARYAEKHVMGPVEGGEARRLTKC